MKNKFIIFISGMRCGKRLLFEMIRGGMEYDAALKEIRKLKALKK